MVEDLVTDPVRISAEAGIEMKELKKILSKLEKLKFIEIKRRGKIYVAKATDKGKDYFENKMKGFPY